MGPAALLQMVLAHFKENYSQQPCLTFVPAIDVLLRVDGLLHALVVAQRRGGVQVQRSRGQGGVRVHPPLDVLCLVQRVSLGHLLSCSRKATGFSNSDVSLHFYKTQTDLFMAASKRGARFELASHALSNLTLFCSNRLESNPK